MRRNFYSNDQTLQHVLRSNLDPSLFDYANKELEAFGELVANEIDERARHTCTVSSNRTVKG